MPKTDNKSIIYQAKNGALEFRGDIDKQTIWATQKQIAEVFGVNSQAITKHISNIYQEGELKEKATCSILEQVRIEGERQVSRKVKFYNLDMIISVGYRINSKTATRFRQWATGVLKSYATEGYAINRKMLIRRKEQALQVIEDIKKLSIGNTNIAVDDVLELIKSFGETWFSLQSYDERGLPKDGYTKKDLTIDAGDLYKDISVLKKELIRKEEASDLFAQETNSKSLEGILGNVFQSMFGRDAYETVEEKAAQLLYFVIKNHPFSDGNKRTGAFSFIWFLQKAEIDFRSSITPEALTALTLLIAESDPKDKDRMVGLVILLLKKTMV